MRDKAAFKRGVIQLELMGHDVEIDSDALSSVDRFSGSDESRIHGIHRAAASGADMALMSRGGYGITRIMQGIRYKSLQKSIEHGMEWVGHSDFTALQLALLAKTGSTTWAGPHVSGDFGVTSLTKGLIRPDPDEIMLNCFTDFALQRAEGTGWRQNPLADGGLTERHVKSATLWGGNLTVLTSLLGTPFFPLIKGGVLFLEDVGEHPYRIERMLDQLHYCGILKDQKAIVLGQFTDFKLTPHDKGFKLQSVVNRLRTQLKIPVIDNLPFGHVPTKVMLPVGAKVDLVLEGRDVLILWGDDV